MHDNLQYKPRRELLQLCRQFGINTGGLQNQQLVTLLRIKLYQDIEGPRVYGSPGNSPRPLNLNSDNPASMADAGDDSVVLEDESEDISQAEDAAQSSPDQLEPEESPSQDSAPVEEGVLEETADVVTEEVTAGEEAVFESDTSSPVEGNLEEPASISEQASGTEAEHEQVQDEAAVGESNAPEENSVEEPVATFSSEEFEGESSVAEGEPAIQDPADHAGSSSDAVPEEPEASSDETKEETTGETDVGVDTLEESTSLLKTGLDEASKTLEQQNEVQDVSASEASTVEVEPAIQDPAVGSDSSPEAVSEETQASSEETKEETTREADLSEGTLEESPIPEGGLGLEEASENSEQQNEVQDAPASEVSVAEGAPVLEDPAALSDSSPETVPEEPQTPYHDTKEEISGETDSSVRSVEESPTPESSLDEASENLEQQNELQDAPTSEARVAEGEPAVQDREIHFDSSPETVPEEPETLSVETKEEATEELDLSVETLKESPIPESRLDEASDNFEQQHELQDAPAPEASVEDGEPALQDPAEASVEDGEPALQDPAVLSDSSPQIVAEEPQTSSDEIREETSEEIESNVRTVEDSPIPESRLDETAEELEQEDEVQDASASEASAANSEPVLQDPAVLSNSSPETVSEEPQTSSEESKEETTGETDASVRTLEEPPFTETRLDATSEKLEQENVVQDASLSEASVAEGGPALQDRGVLSDSSPETVPEELETSPVDIREETPEESDLRVGTVEESPITESRLDETPEESEQENKVQDASASEASAADGGPATRDLAVLSGGSSPEPPQTLSGEPVLEVAYGETKEDPSVENDASVDTLEETPIPVSRSDGPSEQVEQKRGEQDPSAYDSSAAKGETEDGGQDGGLNAVSTGGAHEGVLWDDDHVTPIEEGGVEFKDLPATEAVQTDGFSVAERSPVVSRDISITTQHEIIGGSVLDSDVELRGEEVEAEVPETPAEPDLQPVAGIEGSPKVEDQSAVTAGGPHTIDSAPGLQSKVLGDETVGDAQDPDPEAANKHLGDNAPSVLEADPDQSVSLAPDRVPVTSFFASVGQLPKGTIDEEKELTKLDECYSEAGNKFEDYEVTVVESIPALVAQTSRDYLPTGVSGRGTTVNGEHPPPSASDIEVPVSTQSVQSYYQEQTSIPSQPAATTTTNFFQPLLFWLTQLCSSSR